MDKLRLDLVPPEAEEAIGEVLTSGIKKHGERNWEAGRLYSGEYAALRRHLLAWAKGEFRDPESGLPHLFHALTRLAFLVTYEKRGLWKEYDDMHDKPDEIPV